MKTRNTLILFSAAVLSLLLFPANVMAQFNVKLVTEPRAGRIVPNGEAAKFTVSVTDYAGRPVPFARLRLTFYSPERNPFIHAAFPLAEDSVLFHIQSYIVNGAYSFYYRVPVRGTHRLVVSVFAPQHNIKYKKTIPIDIYMSTAELLRIFLYLLLFFSIGLLAGMFFEKSKAAALAAALAALLFFPSASCAQGERRIMKSNAPLEELAKGLMYSISVKITPERAAAGKMTEIEAVLLDHKKNMVIVPVYFEFETVNARDNFVLFHDTVYSLKGKAKNHVQFFSGANHIVKINAYLKNPEGLNLKPSASFKKEIPVQPFKTPKDAVAKTAVFLLCAMGAGAFAGRSIERNRHGDARRSRRKNRVNKGVV